MKKLLAIIIVSLICYITIRADIPDIKEVKVKRIKGVVSYGTELFEDVEITLSKYGEEKKVIKRVKTNKDGYFEVSNVGSGKYWLFAKTDGFTVHASTVNLQTNCKCNSDFILITLSFSPGECCSTLLVSDSYIKEHFTKH